MPQVIPSGEVGDPGLLRPVFHQSAGDGADVAMMYLRAIASNCEAMRALLFELRALLHARAAHPNHSLMGPAPQPAATIAVTTRVH